MNSETKTCQNCKNQFVIEPEDFDFYKKVKVPSPTFCWLCRRQRRLAWRNYLNYYKRTCDLTAEPVISLYTPDSGIKVYSPRAWFSDKWSALDYGREYDFSKPFFEQYVKLLRDVPKPSMDNDDGLASVNCMYTNDFAMSKDCYLVVKAWKVESVMYSFWVVSGRDFMDAHISFGKDEGNYETVNTEHCYQCRYAYDSSSCSDCAFIYDCRNCNNCFMCTGLRGKSYCFKNEEVGRERYEEILKEYALHTYSGTERAQSEFEPILRNHPRKALRMVNCKDCYGDLMYNCNDCKYCFVVLNSEHYKYCNYSDGARDSYDTDAGGGGELMYETDLSAFSSRITGSFLAWQCQDSSYLTHTYRSRDCFGCSGLKDARYCILNKQYSKEEYFDLLAKIKQHMQEMPYIDSQGRRHAFGDYPPIELSYFPYNDTAAQSLYPLTKQMAEKEGFHWKDQDQNEIPQGAVQAENLPDSIFDVTDDILQKTIISKSSNRKYRIVPQELLFYRKYKIPLPRESFFERHERRTKMATSFRLYERKSDRSGQIITTFYPPDAQEKVWSIEEYRSEFE